jgi:murein DD-endopeptidase MepM/ murein hydrolase activator NlpD
MALAIGQPSQPNANVATGQVVGAGQPPRIVLRGGPSRDGVAEGVPNADVLPTPAPRRAADEFRPIETALPEPEQPEPFSIYQVRAGDGLVAIAQRFGISMMTLWWANDLDSKDLQIGQRLVVPRVDGLTVVAEPGETIGSLASKYGVAAAAIAETNGVGVRTSLREGDRLLIPGARGAPIAVEDETGTGGPTWQWPVPSGHLSQGFGGDHYAYDIAADSGNAVVAARAGTVLFAGWRNNCGGYQVWVDHGDGVSTTYNHLRSVSVGAGQRVRAGQALGQVGSSGCVTGPHVHFEVWRGPIWNGGNRIDPGAFYLMAAALRPDGEHGPPQV